MCTAAGAETRTPEILVSENRDGRRAQDEGCPPEVHAGEVAETRPLEILARLAARPVKTQRNGQTRTRSRKKKSLTEQTNEKKGEREKSQRTTQE